MRWSTILCFVALGVTFGCGGKVVFETSGSGGSGGSVGVTSTHASTSTTSSKASSGSGKQGPGEPTCSNKCATQTKVGCTAAPACDTSCENVFANPKTSCNTQLAAFYTCYDSHPGSGCAIDNACDQEVMAYFNCVDAKCQQNGLSAPGDGSCSSIGHCGTHVVESTCLNGTCTCKVDGASVGSCSDGVLDGSACGFDESCCTSFYPI